MVFLSYVYISALHSSPGRGFFYFGFMRDVLGQEKLKTLGNFGRSLECYGLPESRADFSTAVEKEKPLSSARQKGLHRLRVFIGW